MPHRHTSGSAVLAELFVPAAPAGNPTPVRTAGMCMARAGLSCLTPLPSQLSASVPPPPGLNPRATNPPPPAHL